MTSDVYLIHDGTLDVESLSETEPDHRLIGLEWSQRSSPPAESRVLLYLGDEQLRDLASMAIEKQWAVGVLPHPEAEQATRALGVKGPLDQALSRCRAHRGGCADL